jgi:hypothetical protein
MRIKGVVVVLAGLSVMLSGQAMAQQQPAGGFTPQQLDQMSQQRMQEEGPRNWGPPPPQSSIQPDKIIPVDGLWVCMSAKQWQPVYASPSASSPVIAKTLSQAAVGGREVNGFDPVLVRTGRIGYVAASNLSPFQSALRPGTTCTVEGVRLSGSIVFGYQ